MRKNIESIEQLFFNYAKQFSAILVVLDNNGYIQHINSNLLGVFKDPLDQLIGVNWFTQCVPEHAYDKAITIFNTFKKSTTNKVDHYICPILGINKQEQVISWHSIPQLDDNQPLEGIWMAGFEIEPGDQIAYKKEHSLKQKIITAQTILDHVIEGIITIDTQGSITSFNNAAKILFGYTVDEVIGNDISVLMPSAYQSEYHFETEHKKNIGLDYETIGLHKNGSQFPIELSITEINVDDEKSFVGIVRDISERKKAQEKLELREQELQQIRDRMAHMDRLNVLGEMATGIAHELNQPLTAIATYAQASSRLLDASIKNTDDLTHALNQINEQAQKAGEVIRRLRAMVTIQVGARQCVSLSELILEAIELAKTDSRSQDITMKTFFPDETLTVEIDSVQIQQVILNLIRNALDAIEESPSEKNNHISIKIERDDRVARITIIDNGLGLQGIDKREVFHPFSSTKNHGMGMGMGLAICRSIIKAHEGKLELNSENKTGTEFYFTLPLTLNS